MVAPCWTESDQTKQWGGAVILPGHRHAAKWINVALCVDLHVQLQIQNVIILPDSFVFVIFAPRNIQVSRKYRGNTLACGVRERQRVTFNDTDKSSHGQ